MLEHAPIDLVYDGRTESAACYLVETPEGPGLVDCGPTSCLPALRAGLADRGVDLGDLRHLLLTHIHLDHAGAAGSIVRENPGLTVWISEIAAPHLADPTRLERSARRLYGDAFDALFGALLPVPEPNIRTTGGRAVGFECLPTPGHSAHHVAYLAPDGTLYSGDVAGNRVPGGTYVLPPLPPPEADIEAWQRSLELIAARRPIRLAVAHFGVYDDVGHHLDRLAAALPRWVELRRVASDEAAFSASVRAEVEQTDPELADGYFATAPGAHAFAGIGRYLEQRGVLVPSA